MSSLYQSVRKGQTVNPLPNNKNSSELNSLIKTLNTFRFELIRYDNLIEQPSEDRVDHSVKEVQSSKIVKYTCPTKLPFEQQLPIRPPFQHLWLEANEGGGKAASQIMYLDKPKGAKWDALMYTLWREHKGYVFPIYTQSLWIDADGKITEPCFCNDIQLFPYLYHGENQLEIVKCNSKSQAEDTFKVLQLLNCKNIKVEAAPGFSSGLKGQKNTPPSSIWKRLVIQTPSYSVQSNTVGSSELLTRQHIVRGHFADYTQNSGLFGRHKGIFWIAPHTKGNPDQGTIRKTYSIRKKEA